MLKKIFTLLCFAMTLFTFGCVDNSRKTIENLQQELQNKEEQLKLREQRLIAKEKEVSRREQLLDSLNRQVDTLGTYNPKLIGNWTVTMQCTQTTCEGYAVGDTKTEQWNISYKDHKVVVNAMANKLVVRSYAGLFKDNTLELTAQPAPDAETHMDVLLTPHPTAEKLMEGSRTINWGGNCKVVFSLKAEKQ